MTNEQLYDLIRKAFDEGFSMGYNTRGQGSSEACEDEWNETEAKEAIDQLRINQ